MEKEMVEVTCPYCGEVICVMTEDDFLNLQYYHDELFCPYCGRQAY